MKEIRRAFLQEIRRAFLQRFNDLHIEKENKNVGWTSGENAVVWLPLQQGLPS